MYGYWTNAVVSNGSASHLRATTNTTAGVCLAIGGVQLIAGPVFLSCCELNELQRHWGWPRTFCLVTIASGRITNKLRRAYLNAILHQDVEFFERVGPGEVGTRMLKDISMIKAAAGEKLG